jgi:hypothetical protein
MIGSELPPGLPIPPQHRAGIKEDEANKKTHRKSSHKRKRTQEDEAQMDESFFNSVNH